MHYEFRYPAVGACELAEVAWLAFLKYGECGQAVPISKGKHDLGITKAGYGLPTTLCVKGENAGWIYKGTKPQMFHCRPLRSRPEISTVLDAAFQRFPLILSRQIPVLLSLMPRYLDNLINLLDIKEVKVDEELFRKNVALMDEWMQNKPADSWY